MKLTGDEADLLIDALICLDLEADLCEEEGDSLHRLIKRLNRVIDRT